MLTDRIHKPLKSHIDIILRMTKRLGFVILVFAFTLFGPKANAFSEERIIAVVNGVAITSSDVSTYAKILSFVRGGKKVSKAQALKEAIETKLKIQEAVNRKVSPSDDAINKQVERVASSQKQSPDSYLGTVRKKGIDVDIFKKYLGAQLGWNSIIRRDYGKRVSIDEDTVQKDYQRLTKNPKPGLRLAQIRQVILPFEKGANRQIIGARVADAKSIITRFRGCRSLRSITEDVYNVRVTKVRELPIDKLPAKARQILRKTGPGKMLPPSINPRAGRIELTAYCANRTLKAPVPTIEQYKNKIFFDQIQQYSSRHMKKVKDLAIIEIKGK